MENNTDYQHPGKDKQRAETKKSACWGVPQRKIPDEISGMHDDIRIQSVYELQQIRHTLSAKESRLNCNLYAFMTIGYYQLDTF